MAPEPQIFHLTSAVTDLEVTSFTGDKRAELLVERDELPFEAYLIRARASSPEKMRQLIWLFRYHLEKMESEVDRVLAEKAAP